MNPIKLATSPFRPAHRFALFAALPIVAATAAVRAETPASSAAASGSPGPGANRPSATFASDVVKAERAFKEAARRMDAGKYQDACPLLEQSQALDPSSGTLLNLADCYEHVGRTASAFDAFTDARALAVRSGRTDRAEVAEARAARLASSLRRLIIVPPAAAPGDLVMRLDDKELSPSMWNTPVAIDPGRHELRARGTGVLEFATQVDAPESGTTTSLRVPEFAPLPGGPHPFNAPEAAGRAAALDAPQIAAIASAIVGVAGIVGGTAFGLHSLSRHHESDDLCPETLCSREGVQSMDDARTAGNRATVSFIVGGLGLGTAAFLWFAHPFGAHDHVRAQLGLGAGSLMLRGNW